MCCDTQRELDIGSDTDLDNSNLLFVSISVERIMQIMTFWKCCQSWDDSDKSSFNKEDFRMIQTTALSSDLTSDAQIG